MPIKIQALKLAVLFPVLALIILPNQSTANAGFFDWINSGSSDASAVTIGNAGWTFEEIRNKSIQTIMQTVAVNDNIPVNQVEEPKIQYKVISETTRQVTAYNVGDPYQTDSTPCIGAYSKVNLCDEIAKGVNVCAANFVRLGTRLLIVLDADQNFECIVWDRMNSRYKDRVDIAMGLSEKIEARQFGRQKLKVQIMEKDADQEIPL